MSPLFSEIRCMTKNGGYFPADIIWLQPYQTLVYDINYIRRNTDFSELDNY